MTQPETPTPTASPSPSPTPPPTAPPAGDAETHLHAGPRDEGGHGGMATRELEAREAEQQD